MREEGRHYDLRSSTMPEGITEIYHHHKKRQTQDSHESRRRSVLFRNSSEEDCDRAPARTQSNKARKILTPTIVGESYPKKHIEGKSR